MKLGAPVWYAPSWQGPLFRAVLDSEPRDVGETPCVRLAQLPPAYCQYTKRERYTVPAAALTHVFPRANDSAETVAWADVPEAVAAASRPRRRAQVRR